MCLAGDPLNELADASYSVIPATLSVDIIEASASGNDESMGDTHFRFSCHPNPFTSSTLITYTLPYDGYVLLEIKNVLGTHMTTLVDAIEPSGSHSYLFNNRSLPKGLYFASLKFISEKNSLSTTIKLIKNK